uniref:Si:dkey-174n20.1 n=1 Tax=Callorhinchus milii TaxID=7868 RepID=A0A4W3J743_CALMI
MGWARQGRAGQGRAGAGQGRGWAGAGQGRAGQGLGRAGQGRAGAGQGRAGQGRAGQGLGRAGAGFLWVCGGNSGIGKETAVHLARRGARVIIACRDPVRAEAAVTDIRRRSLSLAVHHRQLDLASLASVRHFCRCFLEAEKRLDVLINNAGAVGRLGWTSDGFQICFGTNHLGPFLLTNLLLDRLRESAPSRVVTVSSDTYTFAKLDFSRLNAEGNRFANYSRSKLANILFTRELARRLEGTGVTAHSLHPGYIFTNWASHYSLGVRLVCYLFMSLFFISSELGSQTTIHCATSDQVLAHNGGYFSNCQPAKLSAQALDERAAKKLWDTSEQLVGLSH